MTDKALVEKFVDALKDSMEPKVVLVRSKSYDEWDEVLREHLKPNV